ncbi:glutamate synthase large subunit [Methylacidiphilum caldifontis]|uniref:Glutamate synthase [NADPH] large chain n=1 Tax=Methylacidiphilum caldifontis TaxID=2795386 RepID=A0A4Y8PCS7_9BACT|nr:glutamate synthase large subunit [Methylacidiphilum caldifontis]TFE68899.1 glutamate synthase subunit alpha [Methylacidiphilum caldifontis]
MHLKKLFEQKNLPPLWIPEMERSSCGVGFVADVQGNSNYSILDTALRCVCALSHRGAIDADMKTGDGAGIMTRIPYDIFRPEIEKTGHHLFKNEDLAIGFCFLPAEDLYVQAHCKKIIEETVQEQGIFILGWRTVPVHKDALGDKAQRTCPQIEQLLMAKPIDRSLDNFSFEQLLFLCRKKIENKIAQQGIKDFYIPSFSCRTIVYKGLFVSPQLQKFYSDLHDPLFKTPFAIYHQRYSTNTFPSWFLSQPFRLLAHNGEINTIQGNRSWTRAKEKALEISEPWGREVESLLPIIAPAASDSASLDNVLEFLNLSGRDILEAIHMLVPAAWQAEKHISEELKSFYLYNELFSEPWDGPAALVFSDGRIVGACLDRNGLRPARYRITTDGLFILGSEAGIGKVEDKTIIEKGRLGPGEVIAVDIEAKKILRDKEIKSLICSRYPYSSFLKQCHRKINKKLAFPNPFLNDPEGLNKNLLCFGYDEEEIQYVLKPMAQKAEEAIGSMGDDAPLAILSDKPKLLYWYFRQLFAQVTNPPIDPIREKLVMSLEIWCGRFPQWLLAKPIDYEVLRLSSPFLFDSDLEDLRSRPEPSLQSRTIKCLFPVEGAEEGFLARLWEIKKEAEEAADEGVSILILSDKGVDEKLAALPMLLVVGAVHHHLIRTGKRTKLSLICETAECRDVHHFACLIGYGATAVNPYLCLDLFLHLHQNGAFGNLTKEEIAQNYKLAVEKGLLKILSKMGISTISSYHGSQLFEALGIGEEVINDCFENTPSRIGGLNYRQIAKEALQRHELGFGSADHKLMDMGYYRYKREGERHALSPQAINSLHIFVGLKGKNKAGQIEDYQRFSEAINKNAPISIRDCLTFRPQTPIPIEEVEQVEEIRKRFTTAAMSYGALSPEAHETLSIAMNRIGGKSNTGEGGEDPERYSPLLNGDSKNSLIKQVASGRFGVTAEYLSNAAEIEIKMAQGSKPGEGGQIPGFKVDSVIARLRRSTPGFPLISPPPHHDIYSIEDLSQLIYDLKQANPRAKICVKLVSEAGVGTIAAGVAKAHADIILISGNEGGTGASPISSIKYAGTPWELGVAETQQVLMLNGLRSRVTLRTDGGLRTGRDIVIAAILGAEEYNFGTMALIAMGCVYVRHCHLNTCPTGIATQDAKLRTKFKGTPEAVIAYLNAVAQEVREILASLGVRSINEIIGRTDLLEQKTFPHHPKAQLLDLRSLFWKPEGMETEPRYHTWERNDFQGDRPLDDLILQQAKSAIRTRRPISIHYKVKNINRSIGTQLSGTIAYLYGDSGLPDGTIQLNLSGCAGQSLGAFLVNGVNICLEGEANDYVGKGMCGGEIVLKAPAEVLFKPEENVICGNTVLYGATGGRFYGCGKAGERFAVRNSGATAVIEGIGDHGCEYMTRGKVIVLGKTGKNFAAGMSGGIAYVYDEEGSFGDNCNLQMVRLEKLSADDEDKELQQILYDHLEKTGSTNAKKILENWKTARTLFWKVVPLEPPQSKPKAKELASKEMFQEIKV